MIEGKNKENEAKVHALLVEISNYKSQGREFELALSAKQNLLEQQENSLSNQEHSLIVLS